MLRTFSLSLSLSLSACSVTTLLTATSHGQSYENPRTRYFVIRVERPVGCSDRSYLFATSLNDCGDMVGYSSDTHGTPGGPPGPGCPDSPWIWSFCGRFGLDAGEAVLLNNLSWLNGTTLEFTPTGPGAAWGINNNGDVVGQQELADFTNAPFVWRFGPSSLIGAFAIGDGTVTGVARAVSESSLTQSAHVVGLRRSGSFGSPSSRGFYHVLGQPTGTLAILDPLTGTSSAAFGVALASAAATPPHIGGASAPSMQGVGYNGTSLGQAGGIGTPEIDCVAEPAAIDAVRWPATGTNVPPTAVREDFLSSGPLDLDAWNARIYAIDGLSQSVGAYVDPSLSCFSRAAFWSSQGIATSLGLISPLSAASRSEALSIAPTDSNGSSSLVVGRETLEFNKGVMWWRPSTTASFQATLSTSLHLSDCDWDILSITDVNAKGWMSATAIDTSEDNDLHAILLIPYGCPADLDLDGIVGSSDLGVLLGAWGSCGGELCSCFADLDYSQDVDSADLSILLGDWGAWCALEFCEGCGEVPAPLGSNWESAGQSAAEPAAKGASLDLILAVTGHADSASFAHWVTSLDENQRAQLAMTIAALEGGNW